MAKDSKIEWTDATWNPWHGCHKVSQGCKNCYMFRDKSRYGQDPNVVVRSKTRFYDPLKWSHPRMIFTCSWSDFFIEEADSWRDEAFAIMALTPQHTYQVLTKRPERMQEYFEDAETRYRIGSAVGDLIATQSLKGPALEKACDLVSALFGSDTDDEGDEILVENALPLPNVWLGVSVEDQKTADERIPLLLDTPAAMRFLSVEPLLGPIDLCTSDPNDEDWRSYICDPSGMEETIDWVVVGGESGTNARPMHPNWARSLRDQCVTAGVPYFFKQWGAWAPAPDWDGDVRDCENLIRKGSEGQTETPTNKFEYLRLVGKKKAGRLLDGREWNEMPRGTIA